MSINFNPGNTDFPLEPLFCNDYYNKILDEINTHSNFQEYAYELDIPQNNTFAPPDQNSKIPEFTEVFTTFAPIIGQPPHQPLNVSEEAIHSNPTGDVIVSVTSKNSTDKASRRSLRKRRTLDSDINSDSDSDVESPPSKKPRSTSRNDEGKIVDGKINSTLSKSIFQLSDTEINNLTSLDFTSYNNSLEKTMDFQNTEQDEEGIEDLDKSEAGTLSGSPLPDSNESMDSIDSTISVDKKEIRRVKNKESARKSRAVKKILLKNQKEEEKNLLTRIRTLEFEAMKLIGACYALNFGQNTRFIELYKKVEVIRTKLLETQYIPLNISDTLPRENRKSESSSNKISKSIEGAKKFRAKQKKISELYDNQIIKLDLASTTLGKYILFLKGAYETLSSNFQKRTTNETVGQ